MWDALPFPDQVKRLLILFIGFMVVWLVARQEFVPETFGDRGHYRAAAIDSVLAHPISYVGQVECVYCHEEEGELKQGGYHRDVSCEVCHGPGAVHANDPEPGQLNMPNQRDLCVLCHAFNPSRPTGFPQIEAMVHNPLEPCVACHEPHDPKPPHTPGTCGACHGEIARTKAVSHHATLDCTRCHEAQEEHKVTPRAYLPTKPVARAFCAGCHDTGADESPEIPRIDADSHGNGHTCWQCHYPHFPEAL